MTYLPYSDSLEHIQPDEEQLTNQILDSMARVNRIIFDRHRHAVRDAHAKSHGTLKGELEIYPNLSEHLRQGIFSAPARYEVIARLSTAPGDLQSDRVAMPRGLAIKVLGVSGTKVLPNDPGRNQDFLLVNHPTLIFGHVAAYLKFQQAIEQLAGAFPIPPGAPPVPNHHILGETFHTMGALRFGRYVAKLSVAPSSEDVRAPTGTPIPEADSALRDLVADYFKQRMLFTNCELSCLPMWNRCRLKTRPSSGLRCCRRTSQSPSSPFSGRIHGAPPDGSIQTTFSVSIPGTP